MDTGGGLLDKTGEHTIRKVRPIVEKGQVASEFDSSSLYPLHQRYHSYIPGPLATTTALQRYTNKTYDHQRSL